MTPRAGTDVDILTSRFVELVNRETIRDRYFSDVVLDGVTDEGVLVFTANVEDIAPLLLDEVEATRLLTNVLVVSLPELGFVQMVRDLGALLLS